LVNGEEFSSSSNCDVDPWTWPVSYSTVNGDCSVEGKGTGREADHSPPFNAKAQNEWSYKSTTGLHGLHKENFSVIFNVNVN